MEIPIDKILPNPEQPRKYFDVAELNQLADSITENGIILPLAVEESADGYYILHDGERRLRAAKIAGLKTVPASVVPGLNGSGSIDRLTRALVANLQRADLGPIEEGAAYQKMIEATGMSTNQLAMKIGVGGARVTAKLLLLKLDHEIQNLIDQGKLPSDRQSTDALLSVPDREMRVALANRLGERRATVKAVVEASARIKLHLEQPRISESEIPAIRLANKKVTLDRQRWDSLAQIGRLPPWILVEVSARETCKACSLSEMANEAVCKDCPLPAMIERLIGKK